MKEPKKDVAACEKSRGGGKQPLIRECLNGETHMSEAHVPHPEHIGVRAGTWRSETSQYPVEKKKKLADFFSSLISNSQSARRCLQHSVSSGERKRSSLNEKWLTKVSSLT